MFTTSGHNRLVRRSALTLKTYVQWMRRFYGYAIALTIVCVAGLAAYRYYVEPTATRQSMFAMKYIDANVFTNKRFGDDPFAIKPFATGLQLENGIQLVKSQVFCERIVENLGLNASQRRIDAFGKRKDLYGSEAIAVYPDKFPAESHALLTLTIAIDGKTASIDKATIDGKTKKTPTTIPLDGRSHPTVCGIELQPTHLIGDYAGDRIEIAVEPVREAANKMAQKLTVVQTAQFTDVLTCTYTDKVVKRADDVLNMIPTVYDWIWRQWNDADAQKFVDAVQRRLDVHTEALETSEATIQHILESGNTGNAQLSFSTLMKQKAADEYDLNNLHSQEMVARDVARQLADDNATARQIAAATAIAGSVQLQKSVAAYNDLVIKREALRGNAGAANTALADINRQLQALHADIKASLNNHIASLEIQQRSLRGRIARTDAALSRLAQTQSALDSQLRDHRNIESQYMYLQGKRGNDPLAINNISEAVRVVAPATSVSDGYHMPLWLSVALGILLGVVVLPILIIFIAYITDNHTRDRYDFAGINIPLIAEIPIENDVPLWRRLRIKFYSQLKSLTPPELTIGSKTRESILMMRTELDHYFSKFDGVPVCMTTSFNPGSGKSFVAINIAVAERQKGKRVLLVDLDIRRATLSKRINSPAHGVTSYLDGSCTDLDRLIVHDRQADIDILPSGLIRPNPAELLELDTLDELFVRLCERYDYIFVDCAPIQLVTDTHVIARVISHTAFVARIGLLDRRQLAVLKSIRDNNELPNMLLVVNGVSPEN